MYFSPTQPLSSLLATLKGLLCETDASPKAQTVHYLQGAATNLRHGPREMTPKLAAAIVSAASCICHISAATFDSPGFASIISTSQALQRDMAHGGTRPEKVIAFVQSVADVAEVLFSAGALCSPVCGAALKQLASYALVSIDGLSTPATAALINSTSSNLVGCLCDSIDVPRLVKLAGHVATQLLTEADVGAFAVAANGFTTAIMSPAGPTCSPTCASYAAGASSLLMTAFYAKKNGGSRAYYAVTESLPASLHPPTGIKPSKGIAHYPLRIKFGAPTLALLSVVAVLAAARRWTKDARHGALL